MPAAQSCHRNSGDGSRSSEHDVAQVRNERLSKLDCMMEPSGLKV
jgi:hypothetical protein